MYVTAEQSFSTLSTAPMCGSLQVCLPETHLKSGAHLFREGDSVHRLYQVKSGVLRLTRLLEDGRRQVIAFGYPGDVVGFPTLGRHHTDCDALTDAQLQPFRHSALESSKENPALHQALLQAALHEISAMQDHFMMLGRKSATEKVASFLRVLAGKYGSDLGHYRSVHLPMSRSDIADFLGLTTETVSRSFSLFRKSKVITLDRITTVVILSPQKLDALADGDAAWGLDKVA